MNKTLLITTLVFLFAGFTAQAQSDSAATVAYYKRKAADLDWNNAIKYGRILDSMKLLDDDGLLHVSNAYYNKQMNYYSRIHNIDSVRLILLDSCVYYAYRCAALNDSSHEFFWLYLYSAKLEKLKIETEILKDKHKKGKIIDVLPKLPNEEIIEWKNKFYEICLVRSKNLHSSIEYAVDDTPAIKHYWNCYEYIIYELKL